MRSKDLQITVAWILLASLFMGAALWQAQVSVAREMARQHESLPPPTNTRHAVRSAPTVSDVDPVADYIARCEKGMTIQEIRWVLTDFENAGLAVREPEIDATATKVSTLRNKQCRWYLHCLVDGLHLSREQAAQATETMNKLIQDEYGSRLEWLENREKFKSEENSEKEISIEELHHDELERLIRDPFLSNWPDRRYMPWNLCKLTAEQEQITWKKWYDLAYPNRPTSDASDLVVESPEIRDPEKLAVKKGGPVFFWPDPYSFGETGTATWVHATNGYSPLLPSQKPVTAADSSGFLHFNEAEQDTFLKKIQRLHPVQLKLTMLQMPTLVIEMREALNNSGD